MSGMKRILIAALLLFISATTLRSDIRVDITAGQVATISTVECQTGVHCVTINRQSDINRTHVSYYAVAAAAGATGVETAITLTRSAGTAATTTGVSFAPTAAKKFRITAISVATRGNATATAQTTTFSIRMNTAGAVTTTSTPIVFQARSATPATALDWDRVIIPVPDGYEIAGDGTLQFGVTAAATYVTNAPTWDVNIIGFEY
jgi:hypothetical protein